MHPYKNFPNRQFWTRSVSGAPWADVFLDQPSKFKLSRSDRIASAGSCFARRISENLASIGYNYEFFESCHPLIKAKSADYGYGVFSCRYGNIYSTRQLRQLFDEALDLRPPIFRFAEIGAGKVIDLMRPNIGSLGFGSIEEARLDRLHHLSRVREMVEQMEVFVFTLGLTETWVDQAANVVFGSHPAVFLDSIPAEAATALNLGYEEVVEDFEYVLDLIRRHNRNPGVRVILTVSPVGLAATHQDSHVLMATTYSKSVLRAAAGKLAAAHDNLDYFPSFEIFSLSQSFGQFLADDLREVNPRGVAVAMRAFESMFLAPEQAAAQGAAPAVRAALPEKATSEVRQAPVDRECEEMANAIFSRTS
jgi:hypothetical protein